MYKDNKTSSSTRNAKRHASIGHVLLGIWTCLRQILRLLLRIESKIGSPQPQQAFGHSKYASTIALVQTLLDDSDLNLRSIPSAVRYIRECADRDSPYYDRIVNERLHVKRVAKKRKDGETKAWNTIKKKSQPSEINKKKPKSPSSPPGPVPIPDLSWASVTGALILGVIYSQAMSVKPLSHFF